MASDKITFISYDEYTKGIDLMDVNMRKVFDSLAYTSGMNDTEQIIASLKGVIPAVYDDIAKERSVTGKAYDLDSK